jgi:plasmid replication initiation protein
MSNYMSMKQRINRAETTDDLERLSKSLDRLYTAGIFSINEFQRLDILTVERHAQIEED